MKLWKNHLVTVICYGYGMACIECVELGYQIVPINELETCE
jgi:hypothetical protein